MPGTSHLPAPGDPGPEVSSHLATICVAKCELTSGARDVPGVFVTAPHLRDGSVRLP